MAPGDAPWLRSVEDVAETLRGARQRNRKCALLIGAGCSVKAGIPAASGIVDFIRTTYPRSYERALEKTYRACMDELSPAERRDVIAHYVDEAKINWAHVCIAQLMREGFVDRVLTTNFDPLVVRACALLGEFPAIYDFAASQLFKSADVPDKAVVYLHGQRSGFVLLNTDEETAPHAELLEPVFDDAGAGRVWIVVGYSGENDPVFERLTSLGRFDNRLYWVGYRDSDPRPVVREQLLDADKSAFYVKGHDADDFFVRLAQELHCFPPAFVGKPFDYLEDLLTTLAPYAPPGGSERSTDGGFDVTETARKRIRAAIERFEDEEETAQAAARAQELLLSGDYDSVVAMRDVYQESQNPDLGASISWAYASRGSALAAQAKEASGADADQQYELAYEQFREALAVQPDHPAALTAYADALGDQAKQLGDAARARALYAEAYELYDRALAADASQWGALRNWAITLLDEAIRLEPEAARPLRALALEKAKRAAEAMPTDAPAYVAWATAIGSGELADESTPEQLEEASALYDQALALDPELADALASSAAVLTHLGQTGRRNRETALAEAEERLRKAESLVPGSGAYNLACLASVRGDEEESLRWLEQALASKALPPRADVERDADLASVRDAPWFREFLDRAYPSRD